MLATDVTHPFRVGTRALVARPEVAAPPIPWKRGGRAKERGEAGGAIGSGQRVRLWEAEAEHAASTSWSFGSSHSSQLRCSWRSPITHTLVSRALQHCTHEAARHVRATQLTVDAHVHQHRGHKIHKRGGVQHQQPRQPQQGAADNVGRVQQVKRPVGLRPSLPARMRGARRTARVSVCVCGGGGQVTSRRAKCIQWCVHCGSIANPAVAATAPSTPLAVLAPRVRAHTGWR